MSKRIAIIGGGPAGLRAAEVCAQAGATVTVFDAKRSVGRKLLVAGYGGLNITHGEPLEKFITRYSGPDLPNDRMAEWISSFTPEDVRAWAAELGIETFEQRTGRVYPKEMKAAPLLRRWIERLRKEGVQFEVKHRLTDLQSDRVIRATFNNDIILEFDAVILALGGGSWPKTGSDGKWASLLSDRGIHIKPLIPANCGWEIDWPAELSEKIEGRPLKNLSVTADGLTIRGELMPTRYGFEGGAIYQLGPALRSMDKPTIIIDFKPEVSEQALGRRLESVRKGFVAAARERLRLTEHAITLMQYHAPSLNSTEAIIQACKSLHIPLTRPRPIDEAISSAGGVAWSEIDDSLMLKKLPGIFVAGEMIDWEAPTGGYLIQGCFAIATHAAKCAVEYRL